VELVAAQVSSFEFAHLFVGDIDAFYGSLVRSLIMRGCRPA
jgi:hypothetical protein